MSTQAAEVSFEADGQAPEVFDPFLCMPPFLRWWAEKKPAFSLLLLPTLIAVVVGANAIQGSIGRLPNRDGYRDVLFALGFSSSPPSTSDYVLTRDLPSLVLLTASALTVALLHLQWTRMKLVLPTMLQTGAIRDTTDNRKMVAGFIVSSNRSFRNVGNWSAVWVAVTFVVLLVAVLGARYVGIFESLAPRGSSAAVRDAVGDAFYDGWWAGVDSFPGVLAYFLVMAIGVFAVVVQNLVGGITLVQLIRLAGSGVTFGIDGMNRDGVSGWRSMSCVLSTVYLSLALHAISLSFIVFVLGFDGVVWVIILLLIWAVGAPAYIFAPLIVFGQRMRAGRTQAIDDFVTLVEAEQRQTGGSVASQLAAAEGVAMLRSLPVRPLGRFQLISVIAFQVLPLLIALVEAVILVRVTQ